MPSSELVCEHCGQPVQTTERKIREAARAALIEAEMTQAELAVGLGVTQKHISQVLSGKTGLSFDFAERMLAALDRRLDVSVMGTRPSPSAVDHG